MNATPVEPPRPAIELLRTFTREALEHLSIDVPLQRLFQQLATNLPCEIIALGTIEQGEPVIRLSAKDSLSNNALEEFRTRTRRQLLAAVGTAPSSEPDAEAQESETPDATARSALSEFIAVPVESLASPGVVMGVLAMATEAPCAFGAQEIERFHWIAHHLSTVFTARERIREASTRDSLTGLLNRRGLDDALERLWLLSRRYGWPLGVVTLDLQNFKAVNDTHGHAVGDSVLVECARLISRAARVSDIVARRGGDEFVVALPRTDCSGCKAFATRLERAIRDHDFGSEHGLSFKLNAAFGLASSGGPSDVGSPAELLRRSDPKGNLLSA